MDLGQPDLQHENQYRHLGFRVIAGVDEVGMGCLAGPVVAAAVVLDFDKRSPRGIDDSKKLSAKKREELDLKIREAAVCFGIGVATVEEIDAINIYHASRLAMKRAIEQLSSPPEIVLLDGRGKIELPENLNVQQKAIVKGDQKSVSIAAASILAKVFRDDLMRNLDVEYPGYEFARHKGYGSKLHREYLQQKGRSPIHRKTFSWTPV